MLLSHALSLAPLLLVFPPQDEPDFVPLLDGTLDHWHGDRRFWSLEDGVLVGRSTPETPCAASTYLIWTGGLLGDFELRLRFRITGGDSGVQFRGRQVGDFGVAGYQADIEHEHGRTGGLLERDGRGELASRGQAVSYAPDGARAVRRFAEDAELRAAIHGGQWNEYRIRAVGERIELWVNGRRTVEVDDRDEQRTRLSGILALELHAGPPMRVEFADLLLLDLGGAEEPPATPEPHWIWSSDEPRDEQAMWTCNSLTVGPEVERATLWGSCDDHCEVFLNGIEVAESHEWTVPFRVDVTDHLREGINALAAWGRNDGGPAALWLELVVEYADGRAEALVTDDTWLVSPAPSAGWQEADGAREGWKPATSFGELGVEPWGTPTATFDGVGASALVAEELELPVGFAAELVYSVPRGKRGSWVSLTFDPQGRAIACDQYGSLYRLTPPPLGEADGAPQVERIDVELGSAHGLLCAFDSLYVVVGEGREAGLYRVRDTDGDDHYDSVEYLKHLRGSGEHGPHAVILHPDGRSLVIVGGNHTALPEGIARSRPTQVWAEDQLLPRRPDPNGHAAGVMAPGGWIVRTDPDGREWELFCMGFRNAYDIAFDPDDELFTFDSDMEWDVGLPWYRPTRICHAVSGADFGWRHGSGKWPEYSPDSLPAVVDVGLSSPTGVTFGTETAFHGSYRAALFAADWSYGTIYAVHLEPRGASFTGTVEPFVRGKPFPVTDLAVGPDGALYVTTGGRRTQSGLYRIYSQREPAPRPGPTQSGFRSARRVIERNHGLGVPSAFWSELGSADRFIAHAARTAIEQTAPEHWAERALAEDNPRIALQALIALARTHAGDYGERILERLLDFPLESWESELVLPWARLYGLALARVGAPEEALAARFVERLDALFPTGRDALDRELLRLLVYLQAPSVAEEGVQRLEAAATQEEAIHHAFTLRTLEAGWTLPLRRRYFGWLNEVGPTLSGGHSLKKYVEGIRADAIERLPDELRAWPDLLAPPPAAPETRTIEATFVHAWTMDELVPHLEATKRGRDFESGTVAYLKATCAECHIIGGAGGGNGPDLTGAGSRFSARDLLEAIVRPSATISDQYQETEVLTKDEIMHVGRIVEDGEEYLVLRTLQDELVEIDRADVALRRAHPLSRMPSGLLDTLTRGEILDLLAYCLAGASADDPAFDD